MQRVKVKDFFISKGEPLTIISGPCVIESEEHTMKCAEELIAITKQFNVNFIFKASYDKANRSSITSFRGPGLKEGLRILEKVKKEFNVPVLSDIHTVDEIDSAKQVLDVLQIPAFLCRQTDLLVACAKTQLPIQVKKGQFVAPHDMGNVVEKITACGNNNIILADRGTSFGYNNLVADMRAIAIMQEFGFPVSFDASHAVQLPGALGAQTGGDSKYSPLLAKAAVAAGCQVIFIETHPNPKEAKSDSASVYPLNQFSSLLAKLVAIYQVVNDAKI